MALPNDLDRDMTQQFIFAHIPKTAGTSFRLAFAEYLQGRDIILDYGAKAADTSEIVRQRVYGNSSAPHEASEDIFGQPAPTFISGHFHDTKLGVVGYAKHCPDAELVTFVRDPIQRAISEFYHFRNHYDYQKTFTDFIRTPAFMNRQRRALGGVPLSTFAFIGITERYDESLAAFNSRFGTKLRSLKTNLRDPAKGALKIGGKELDEFCRLNIEDIELYNAAFTRYVAEKSYPRAGIRYLSRFQYSVRRDEHGGISGWIASYESHTPPLVTVHVDGQQVMARRACLYRPDTVKHGVHLTGYCGFRIEPHALAATAGDAPKFEIHVPGFKSIYRGSIKPHKGEGGAEL